MQTLCCHRTPGVPPPRSRPAGDERGIFLEALKLLEEDARGAVSRTCATLP